MGKNYKNKNTTPTMNVGDTIKLNGYTYQLVQRNSGVNRCYNCIFGVDGRCCLFDDDNILKDKAEELNNNCLSIPWGVYKLVKFKHDDSSTGVVNPSTDAAPKEPKGLDKYTTRRFTKEVTLEEARNWYNSHNELLRDFATRIFTPAELEDVRRCTMDIDIKTAKRLYRNAENAVRDFVLSAFSEEELKD